MEPASSTQGCPANPQLLEVHVYFRHGDRSPTPLGAAQAHTEVWARRVQEVPQALQKREFFPQKFPWGLLTTKGAQQARELGAWLGDNYIPKFTKSRGDLNLQEVPQSFLTIRTTTFLRTNLTAWFLLEGLLKSPEAPASIPFVCREEKDENLYHNEHCPRLLMKWVQAWESAKTSLGPNGKNWRASYKELQDAMARALEIEVDDPKYSETMDGAGFPWITAVDTFVCAMFHGDPLPAGVSEEDVMAVRTLVAQDYAATFQDRDVLQLSIGTLVRELREAIAAHVGSSSTNGPSLHLYSGHDATIMPLSVALGLPWTTWPGYTSSIAVELWRTLGEEEDSEPDHFVRVLYDREKVAIPISRDEGAEKKVMLSLAEFDEVCAWSSVSDAEFRCRCQEVSDVVPVPNRIVT